MNGQSLTCPKCGNRIPLTEAFTHEVEEKLRAQYEAENRKRETEFQHKIEAERKTTREAYERQLAQLEQQAKQQAQESVSVEIKDLRQQLDEKKKQVEASQRQELELRKRQRDLEEWERTSRLEMERKLDDERKQIWTNALAKAADEHRMKDLEKDKQLSDMRKQIDELKRKAELGSQQAQGEVLEIELESMLGEHFRHDRIAPVPKGIKGADVIQEVRDERGRVCGHIIWESKRTKSWNDGWIQKLKDDQRSSKAEIAVLVSTSLPSGVERFGMHHGIWVTDFPSAVGLAAALRANLIQVHYARNSQISKNDKMELLYKYLAGPEFKQRVEAILETFVTMKNELDAEKRSMERTWARRETQINRVIQSTAGLHGDLQGLIGSTMPEVKLLELPFDEDDKAD